MGQRLGIAAALLGDPQVLLFDEPVNGLDPEGILWVRNLMKQLASEGRTVFVSSHLMSEMALTADHLIVIGRGQLLADMSVKDFISHNSADFARVRTAADRAAAAREADRRAHRGGRPGACPSRTARCGSPGCRCRGSAIWRTSADVRLWELSPHQASLEEAYMRMTQGAVDYRSTRRPAQVGPHAAAADGLRLPPQQADRPRCRSRAGTPRRRPSPCQNAVRAAPRRLPRRAGRRSGSRRRAWPRPPPPPT